MSRLLSLLFVVAAACGDTAPAMSDGANPDAKCNPLAVGDCALPWPSSYYLTADSSTRTGWRVNIPKGVLPSNPVGMSMDPARLNTADGFSPATTILVNLKARVATAQLPPYTSADLSGSQAPSSTVQLLRYDTGERVPLFAEPDVNVMGDEDQALIIRPMVRLQPNTRYVVALLHLVDSAGKPITVAPFEALKAGRISSGSTLGAIKPLYDELFNFLDGKGVPRAQLTLAWDFRTGSDEAIRAHMIAIRDQGLQAWDAQKLGYTITDVKMPVDDHLAMQLQGTFEVPSFLVGEGPYDTLKLDAQGAPQLDGKISYPFKVNVPKCALTTTKPVPFLIYGHGLFGSSNEINSGWQKQFIDTKLCMVEIATNWVGLDEEGATAVAAKVLANFTNLPVVTDRLQQGNFNFLVLAHMAVRVLKNDSNLKTTNGMPMTDGSEIYYLGCSQGGIEGGTFLALSPDVSRGGLNVGAGEYSLMLSRSADFRSFKDILDGLNYSQKDQQLLLALMQPYWDFTDPISFASVLGGNPLPDYVTKMPMPLRRFTYQEGLLDAQVPNMATRVMVRSMGIPLLGPGVEPVFGVPVKTGPLDAAYTQWDVHASPAPPVEDIPAPHDNQTHEAVRRIDAAQEQLKMLFRPDGRVVQTCPGPCVYPAM